MFVPKIFSILNKGYSFSQFKSDLMSGIIVGVVAIPLSIAFSIASGVTPERGLITAVIAGLVAAFLGGSRVQISGPTGAFLVIISSIVHQYGVDGLIIATLMGGLILVVFGIAGMGGVIKYIPQPVVIGFTSGIALIIFSSQIKDLLGLQALNMPSAFFAKWFFYLKNFSQANFYALFIGIITIVLVLMWQKYVVKIPGTLFAIVFVSVIVNLLNLPVETIGDRFGNIQYSIPMPVFPVVSFSIIKELIPVAFTIAILAGVESLLSAIVTDGMIGGKHKSNMELIAQGFANICSALFGGIPATGALARSAVNVQNGGRTPVAAIVHSITVFFIMIFLGKMVALVPMACLSGVLIMVAYKMSEVNSFIRIMKSPKSDVIVLLATFSLTVLVDLTVAIEVGMVLAAFLFIRRLANTSNIKYISADFVDSDNDEDFLAVEQMNIPENVEVYEIQGPFFFGVASSFIETVRNLNRKPRIKILRMRNVHSLDATAIHALRQIVSLCVQNKIIIILSGLNEQPLAFIKQDGLMKEIGSENVFNRIEDALFRAEAILSEELSYENK